MIQQSQAKLTQTLKITESQTFHKSPIQGTLLLHQQHNDNLTEIQIKQVRFSKAIRLLSNYEVLGLLDISQEQQKKSQGRKEEHQSAEKNNQVIEIENGKEIKTNKVEKKKKEQDQWFVILPGYAQTKNKQQQFSENQDKNSQSSSEGQKKSVQKQEKEAKNTNQQLQIHDIQLAVTGKMKWNQNPVNATIRQVMEQIGINVEIDDITGLGTEDEKIIGINSLEIIRCQIFPSIIRIKEVQTAKADQKLSQKKDRGGKIIQSWVLIKNPCDIFKRKRINTQDGAGKIVGLIKLSKFKQVIKQLKLQRQSLKWNRKQLKQQKQNNQPNPKQYSPESLKQFKRSLWKAQEQSLQLADLKQLDGKILYKHSEQSIQTQQKIQKMSTSQLQDFLNTVYKYIPSLLRHWPGNYVIQALFKHCNQEQRKRIIQITSLYIYKISTTRQGGRACQNILKQINPSQVELLQTVFDEVLKSFIQISTNQYGYHFLRLVVKIVPLQKLILLKQYIQNSKIFVQLVTDQFGIFVMQDLFTRIQSYSKEGNQISTQLKQQMVSQLAKSLKDIICSPANYFVQMSYQILPLKQMDQITSQIIKNFKILSQEEISILVVCRCVEQFWKMPEAKRYYKKLAKRLSPQDIQQMYRDRYANRSLRRIMQTQEDYPEIKSKIVNVILNEKKCYFDKGAWWRNIMAARKSYQKVGDTWVIKSSQI